ncbi:hypothetical protein HMI54_012008, partial [Coelomomyces lativittatus]
MKINLLESLLEKFSFCSQEVQSLRLFSTNEDFEEILTQHLPLLLIDAFMAEILIKLKSTDLKDRARLVTRAKTALQSFLDQCELYDLIPPSEFKYSKAMSNPSLPPMERRNLKIHRQKESKERQRALDDLQVQIQTVFASLPVTQTSILPPSIFLRPSNAQLKSPSPLPCLDDEETLSRSFCVQWIQSWISKSIDTMLFLDEELHHLHFALSLSPTTGSPSVPLDDQTQLDVLPSSRASQAQDGPLLDPKGKVLRSFSIVSQRSQLQHQVFQPGHRLPTMTIDEYLEAEKNRGGILDG